MLHIWQEKSLQIMALFILLFIVIGLSSDFVFLCASIRLLRGRADQQYSIGHTVHIYLYIYRLTLKSQYWNVNRNCWNVGLLDTISTFITSSAVDDRTLLFASTIMSFIFSFIRFN